MSIFKRLLMVAAAVLVGVIIWSFQPNSFPRFELTADAPPDGGHRVLIFGATRNTGLDVAEILANRGDKVTAFVRPSSDLSGLEPFAVDYVEGDAVDMDTVEAAFVDHDYTAVITTIACFSCDPKPDYIGNRNIFDAAQAAGVKRVILITTVGAGDSYDSAPLPARRFLKDILPLKTQAEDHLKSLDLDYTIIRPGGLKSDPPTGQAYLSDSREAFGIINRADLAQLIVGVLDDNDTIGKTLAAMDADMVFPWDMF
jgi:uncharacterized protein YbjT (DUF2867 family)